MSEFRPMLASPADLDRLRYPLLASPKLDGIRAIVKDRQVLSRKLLPIPNKHVQKILGADIFHGLDGELIVGNPTDHDVYRRTNSAVMGHEGEPAFTFYVFDLAFDSAVERYDQRMHHVMDVVAGSKGVADVRWLTQSWVEDRDELDQFERICTEQGYEGIMLRDPAAFYKHGRSTAREGILLKLKRFEDSEAEVLRIEEEMANLNEAGRDALGRTKRSHAKAGKVGKGTMGALVVRDLKTGVEFNIGSGFTAADRADDWKPGEIVRYKFFPVGVKDRPRHPIFQGRRSKLDL